MKTNLKNRTICFVFGTRPEIIKLAPVIKACINSQIDFIAIHTGQHYSENMDKVFFDGLKLPTPNYNLKVGSGQHGQQTAKMLTGIEEILLKHKTDIVVVQGDTNSVLAGALAASKLNIPVAHVEAGLRSYDRTMPEELNRILTGSVATWHFTPTSEATDNLLFEGIDKDKIHQVGNTVVDAVLQNIKLAEEESRILQTLEIESKTYSLVTIHRPENTDSKDNLKVILNSLNILQKKHGMQFIWPIHPRTAKQIEHFGLNTELESIKNINIIEPVGFFDMLMLQKNSLLNITDSGGIQEESCILGTPCITVRNNTERPESVIVGANILAGCNQKKIEKAVDLMLSTERKWKNPFGKGNSSELILKAFGEYYSTNSAQTDSKNNYLKSIRKKLVVLIQKI